MYALVQIHQMTRFGLGDDFLRLRFVFKDWLKNDEELWKFLHKGGSGSSKYKSVLAADMIAPTGKNKAEQHWNVKAGFRIDHRWFGDAVDDVEWKCAVCVDL